MKKLLIVLALFAFVFAVSMPAIAQEKDTETRLKAIEECIECLWKFYGSARMTSFWTDVDKEVPGTAAAPKVSPLFDDTDLSWTLQTNSRIGAIAKVGDIGGRFEYGSAPNLRLLYGTWSFGAGEILVGQGYTPFFSIQSNQVWGDNDGDGDLVGQGAAYAGRKPMVQLSMSGFKLALITPNVGQTALIPIATAAAFEFDTTTGLAKAVAATAGYTAEDTDTTIPKIEASYTFNLGPVSLTPMAGYNTYSLVDTGTDREWDVDSYVYGLDFVAGFGPLTFKGVVWAGQNTNAYGIINTGVDALAFNAVTDSIVDVDTVAFNILATFKANDMLTFEAGYGWIKNELDQAGGYEDPTASYYVNCTINIAKGFFVVPEVGVIDYKDTETAGVNTDEGKATYFGAKWQINW